MFGLGMGEIIIILIVALLVLGPSKLPEAARSIGKGIRELRRHTRDLQETIEQDEHLGGTVRELRSVLRGDDPILPPNRPAGVTEPHPGPPGAPPTPAAGAAPVAGASPAAGTTPVSADAHVAPGEAPRPASPPGAIAQGTLDAEPATPEKTHG